jgi:hypothetical protein
MLITGRLVATSPRLQFVAQFTRHSELQIRSLPIRQGYAIQSEDQDWQDESARCYFHFTDCSRKRPESDRRWPLATGFLVPCRRVAAARNEEVPRNGKVSYQSFSPSRQAGWSRGDAKLKRDSYSSVVPGLAVERQSPQALLLSVARNASGANALVALVQALAYLMSERRSDPLHQCGLAEISVPVSLSETGGIDLPLTKNTHHQ